MTIDKTPVTIEELQYLAPDVSLEDRNNLIAYSQAKRRLNNKSIRVVYSPEQRHTDEFVAFSLGRTARRANKKIFKSFLNDLSIECELIVLQDKCHRWELITSNYEVTANKLVAWTTYLNINHSLYSQHEENTFSGNSLINLSFYNLDNIAMMDSNAGWYDKTGKRIKDLSKKIDVVYRLGYLLAKRRTPTITRPRAANRKDVEFLTKLVGFYETTAGEAGGYGLRSDIKNTIRRFTNSYQWPGMELLQLYDKPNRR